MNIFQLNVLNDYFLRVISAHNSDIDGRHFDIPLEDRQIDICVTLAQLRLLQSSIEWRILSNNFKGSKLEVIELN